MYELTEKVSILSLPAKSIGFSDPSLIFLQLGTVSRVAGSDQLFSALFGRLGLQGYLEDKGLRHVAQTNNY